MERENKENKLVLVFKVNLLSFAVKGNRQMRQSWVAVWSQISFGVFKWEILQHIYFMLRDKLMIQERNSEQWTEC